MVLVVWSRLEGRIYNAALLCFFCLVTAVVMAVGQSLIERKQSDRPTHGEKYVGPYEKIEQIEDVNYIVTFLASGAGFFVRIYYLTVWTMIKSK